MSTRKKQSERFILERFLALLPVTLEGEVRESESPDFIIGSVGIELVKYYWDKGEKGSASQERTVLKQGANKAARKEWRRRGHRPIGLEIGWSSQHHPPKKRKDRTLLTERLVNSVELLESRGLPSFDDARSTWWSLPSEVRPPEITYVAYLPRTDSWESSIGGGIMELQAHHVQTAVDGKEPLLATYRERCDEIWLLVHSADTAIGSTFASPWADEEPIKGEVRTGFDRVFFLNFGDEPFEFPTIRRGPKAST